MVCNIDIGHRCALTFSREPLPEDALIFKVRKHLHSVRRNIDAHQLVMGSKFGHGVSLGGMVQSIGTRYAITVKDEGFLSQQSTNEIFAVTPKYPVLAESSMTEITAHPAGVHSIPASGIKLV
jgi:hypothetical protein